MIHNGNIVMSQSMTKELGVLVVDDQVELAGHCPKRFASKFISEDYPWVPSTNMVDGLYAETKLLGSAARGAAVHSLKPLKSGAQPVRQGRIDAQMHRMDGFMRAHGVRFDQNNTQVRLLAKYAPKIWLTGEMDIFPTQVNSINSIVDLKTTKDIFNDFFSIAEEYVHFSGNACWGSYDQIFKNQPLFYHFLARNFYDTDIDLLKRFNPSSSEKYDYLFSMGEDYSDVDFWFFVAGIGKPDYDDQLAKFEYPWSDHRSVLLHSLVENSIERIQEGMSTDFAAKPSPYVCRDCALKDVCDSFMPIDSAMETYHFYCDDDDNDFSFDIKANSPTKAYKNAYEAYGPQVDDMFYKKI